MIPLLEHETEPIYRLRAGLEQIVRDTRPVGSDFGIPHVAALASELLKLCQPSSKLNPPRWRVGGRVKLNVYEVSSRASADPAGSMADRPICQCHSEEDAQRIVKALNLVEPFPPEAA